MVASLRVTLRKVFILVICGGCIALLLFYTRTANVVWFPSEELLGNKRTVLTHNGSPDPAESTANGVASDASATDRHDVAEKDWYFRGGTRMPKKSKKKDVSLLSEQVDPGKDRIQEQLMYVPEDYEGLDTPEKTILLWNGLSTWGIRQGTAVFQGCPVSRCSVTPRKIQAKDADAILFKDYYSNPGFPRPLKQVWILYLLECPYHTPHFARHMAVFNWTATYRVDSDIVAPYERWTYYDPNVKEKPQHKDYAANKTKKVAWFVSNCGAKNGRLAYAEELAKYIPVDIYGACGPHSCPRSSSSKCFELLDRDYKFYLAFENSNCRDYITEKFFVNGLQHDVIPVVMGARPSDYERAAPLNSFVHVDDFGSPAELADFLHQLDKDDEQYNSYFRWKGTGEFINTYFWCRLCAMLHAPLTSKVYHDINEWWRGKGVCTTSSWRDG